MTFDDRLSHLLADAAGAGEEPGDVFSEQGAEQFLDWLERPGSVRRDVRASTGTCTGSTREREDLRRVYPDLDGSDGDGLRAAGRGSSACPRWGSRSGSCRRARRASSSARARPGGRRAAGRTLPRGPQARPVGEGHGPAARHARARRGGARLRARRSGGRDIPVSTSTVDVREFVQLGGRARRGLRARRLRRLGTARASAGFNLICINADELPRFADSRRRGLLPGAAGDRRLGLGDRSGPGALARARSACSTRSGSTPSYVAENLGRAAPIPVRRMPPPVSPPDPGDVAARPGHPERLPVPVHVRLLQHHPAQEPGRPDRGVPRTRSSRARGRSSS